MTLDTRELLLVIFGSGGVGMFIFYLIQQLPLKEIILDWWRGRRGTLHRIEQLLRLKQMSDEKCLSFPLEWSQELQASGFVDQSWEKTFDRVKALEGKEETIEVGIAELLETWMQFQMLFYLIAEKSYALAVWTDMWCYTVGVSGEQQNVHRHNFQLWWGLVARVRGVDHFRARVSEVCQYDTEELNRFFALMESYAAYCKAPSRRAFDKWMRDSPAPRPS